jgi:hypothetical protein
MRDYAQVSPRFWTGETGKKLRGHPEAQVVAFYLMTCPGSHMIGVYPLELPTLCHHTGLSPEGATKGLARLSKAGFAAYDAIAEVIWVPEMARFQIGDELNGNDNRIKSVEKEIENYRKCAFFNDFLDKYAKAFKLKTRREQVSPSGAPPEPLGSQEQEQEQEQEKEQKQDPSDPCVKLYSPRARALVPVFDKHDIPGELLRAIARVESSFRPNARNDKNDPGEGADIGLMQINERTARALKRDVSLLNDPAYNLETACLLLVSLRRELGPKFSLMTWAAAYNAGAPAIRRRGVFNQAYASNVVWHALLYQIASGLRG